MHADYPECLVFSSVPSVYLSVSSVWTSQTNQNLFMIKMHRSPIKTDAFKDFFQILMILSSEEIKLLSNVHLLNFRVRSAWWSNGVTNFKDIHTESPIMQNKLHITANTTTLNPTLQNLFSFQYILDFDSSEFGDCI